MANKSGAVGSYHWLNLTLKHIHMTWDYFQSALANQGQDSKPLKNRSQLGDPVSLKAETSKTSPTEHDRPNQSKDRELSLKELAEKKMEMNPTQLGDPVSLKAETSTREPTENDRGAASDKEAVEYDRESDKRASKGGRSKLWIHQPAGHVLETELV